MGTSSESMMRASLVRSVAPITRALATMMRSAGSRGNDWGNDATSAAIAGEIPQRATRANTQEVRMADRLKGKTAVIVKAVTAFKPTAELVHY